MFAGHIARNIIKNPNSIGFSLQKQKFRTIMTKYVEFYSLGFQYFEIHLKRRRGAQCTHHIYVWISGHTVRWYAH